MIDIIFVILSFFIISSLFLVKLESIPLNLPNAETSKNELNDPIIVSLDIGKMAYEEYRTNPISEHRLFYVAFSRAKENLFIITPQSREAYRI